MNFLSECAEFDQEWDSRPALLVGISRCSLTVSHTEWPSGAPGADIDVCEALEAPLRHLRPACGMPVGGSGRDRRHRRQYRRCQATVRGGELLRTEGRCPEAPDDTA